MSWNQAEDGPYDYSRERFEAAAEDSGTGDYVQVNGVWYDTAKVPDELVRAVHW